MTRFDTPGAAVRGYRPEPQSTRSARRFSRAVLLVPALALVAAVWLLLPRAAAPDAQTFAMPAQTAPPRQAFTLPDSVRKGFPEGYALGQLAVPETRLREGRMLLIDEGHPLPEGYTPADTLNILNASGGRATCRDLSAVLGEDALGALSAMLTAARQEKHMGLVVFAGSRSPEQQRILLTDTLAALSRDMSLDEALSAARSAVASPGYSEHQTAWAVDIRVCPQWNGAPLAESMEESEDGRWLMENCWRYGFIRRYPGADPRDGSCRAYHLRYVGCAHASLMHALGLSLEDYLSLMHNQRTLTLYDEASGAPLCSAVCAEAEARQTLFILPEDASVEDLSLDNLGFAVVSCVYGATSPTGAP